MEIQAEFKYETTNATDNYEEHNYPFDDIKVRVIFLVVYSIVFCSCFIGNLFVMLVITLHWRMRSKTNFCLANLAFADLCVGVFCVYQNIVTYLMDSWVFGDFMCKMYYFVNSLSTTASVLILVVICIERYLAIIHPLMSKQIITLNRLRITIVFVWILSAGISSPRFYYFQTISIPLPNHQLEIVCVPDRTKFDSKLMDMFNMTFLFLVPLAVFGILYTHMSLALWKSIRTSIPCSNTIPSAKTVFTSPNCIQRNANLVETSHLSRQPAPPSTPQQCLNRLESLNYVSAGPPSCTLHQSQETFSEVLKPDSSPTNNSRPSENLVFRKSVESLLCTTAPIVCSDQELIGFNRSRRDSFTVVKFEEHTTANHLRGTRKCTTLITKGADSVQQKDCGVSVVKPSRKENDAENLAVQGCCGSISSDSPSDKCCAVKMNGFTCFGLTQCEYRSQNRNLSVQNERKLTDDSRICMHQANCIISSSSSKTNKQGTCAAMCVACGSFLNDCLELNQQMSSQSTLPAIEDKTPRRVRRLGITRSNIHGSRTQRTRRRIIRMLITVVFTFAVCHFPLHARKVWQYWSPQWAQYKAGSQFSSLFTPITFLIMYANSALNPIVYAFMSENFRKSLLDLICCRMRHTLKVSRNAFVRSAQ